MVTILTAEMLSETHPMLPEGWRSTMPAIRNEGGPWRCDAAACGGPSYLCYRCSKCGNDLATGGTTSGRQGGTR